LLGRYRPVGPLPAGYQEQQAVGLAGRLLPATLLVAHGPPAAAHLDLLRAFTARRSAEAPRPPREFGELTAAEPPESLQ
jgi:hypothetical protein